MIEGDAAASRLRTAMHLMNEMTDPQRRWQGGRSHRRPGGLAWPARCRSSVTMTGLTPRQSDPSPADSPTTGYPPERVDAKTEDRAEDRRTRRPRDPGRTARRTRQPQSRATPPAATTRPTCVSCCAVVRPGTRSPRTIDAARRRTAVSDRGRYRVCSTTTLMCRVPEGAHLCRCPCTFTQPSGTSRSGTCVNSSSGLPGT